MLLFDSHVHIGVAKLKKVEDEHSSLPAYDNATTNTFSNYLRMSTAKGVTKCLAFPFPFNELNRAAANNYILECAHKEPTLILPLFLPDNIKNIEIHIDDIYGIKEHFYLNNSKDSLFRIYDLLQQTGKVLLVHAHMSEWTTKVADISANFPELKIIIAHSARSLPFTSENIINNIKNILSVSKKTSNLFFDTSTIRSEGAILTELINLVGDEQILWGSDFPFYKNKDEDTYALEINFVANSSISVESKNKIFNQNFKRLFQIDNIWVRHACEHDTNTLLNMLEDISESEKKLLALNAKSSFIRQMFRKPKHVFVAENSQEEILGFLRKSDRPNNGAIIEEVYVPTEYRGNGVGRLLTESVIKGFNYAEMKTYSFNDPMINIAKKAGFLPSFTPQKTMINWRLG